MVFFVLEDDTIICEPCYDIERADLERYAHKQIHAHIDHGPCDVCGAEGDPIPWHLDPMEVTT